ncbi:ABC-type dipeptide/oligopeptide/nickel transport systems, permease component [Alteracholeplasma palmae J233]|uniref:ABC-type dipeptide/oligopeptide/nickel transport systems, permease component n=1 Tax=Alteracholeplasma palmae (strain ATCC 49389 / J233) TaxID=1318466 RepID=U4KJY7_ALTPJ|nr:ABC transporter permease [Alteracholeplasma palmae]CCV63797.1 ABC-type dipeptide/oligopeptide/nickel transport systems, permease component [Alteracholeplasma palmae J233]
MSEKVVRNKEDFVFVQNNQFISDEALKTKPIGYYKDAWNRLKKNKVSLASFFILAFLFFMVIFAPLFNGYSVSDRNVRLKQLPAKIQGLEKIGIFNGTKVIQSFNRNEYKNLEENGIVKKVVEKEQNSFPVYYFTVDYYAYVDYQNTYGEKAALILTASEFNALNPELIVKYETINQTVYRIDEAEFNKIPDSIEVDYIIEDSGLYRFTQEEWEKIASLELIAETSESIMYQTNVKYFQYLGYKEGETPYYWFGSDLEGRDLFTVLWTGARISLMVAFAVALTNIAIGIVIGAISGYYGGVIDLLIERFTEVLSGIPFMAVLTLMVLRFGNGFGVIVVAFTLTGWIGIASLTRTQFYRYKNREYVLASRTLGASDFRIMSRHIFPNAAGTLITSVVLIVPAIIFTESTYSYLGIINYGDIDSVGRLLSIGQTNMIESPHLLLYPAIFISILMLAFNLFGNGLRDAFNPSLRGVDE